MTRLEDGVWVTESVWSDEDRGLLIALLAEQRDVCNNCGHPMSICRDPKTQGSWRIVESVCEPGRIMEAHRHNASEQKRNMRGVIVGTRRG